MTQTRGKTENQPNPSIDFEAFCFCFPLSVSRNLPQLPPGVRDKSTMEATRIKVRKIGEYLIQFSPLFFLIFN